MACQGPGLDSHKLQIGCSQVDVPHVSLLQSSKYGKSTWKWLYIVSFTFQKHYPDPIAIGGMHIGCLIDTYVYWLLRKTISIKFTLMLSWAYPLPHFSPHAFEPLNKLFSACSMCSWWRGLNEKWQDIRHRAACLIYQGFRLVILLHNWLKILIGRELVIHESYMCMTRQGNYHQCE